MLKISLINKTDYVHVQVTGTNQILNIANYWRQVADNCRENNCKRAIIEDKLTGHVGQIEIYQLYKHFTKKTGMPPGCKVAIVYPQKRIQNMEFAMTVMMNWSGINLKHFTDIDTAKSWLLDD